MTAQYGGFMWGADITLGENDDLVFSRSTGVGSPTGNLTATLDPSPAVLPDYVPFGDGDAQYDLLTNIAAAMNDADPNAPATTTYTAEWEMDAILGMTGNIVITESNGQTFTISWNHANTTIEPAWLGAYPPAFTREDGYAGSVSSGSSTYTMPYPSSLIWLPGKSMFRHDFEPIARAVTSTQRAVSGKRWSTRWSYRAGMRDRQWGTFQALDYESRLGGTLALRVGNLPRGRVFTLDDNKFSAAELADNSALVNWHEWASAGRWFIVYETNEKPGIDDDTYMHVCRIRDDAAMADLGAIVTKQARSSPEWWDAAFLFDVIDLGELGAGGS